MAPRRIPAGGRGRALGGGIRLTGQWKQWLRSLDPEAFKRRLRVEVRKATLRNLLLVVREIRVAIRDGDKYAPNSMLQLAAKYPKSKPLVAGSDLLNAVTHQLISDFAGFVGVKRSARGKDGEELVNIAAVLHEGVERVVTPAMRAAVFARIREENPEGYEWLQDSLPAKDKSEAGDGGNGGGPTVWVCPPRPFIKDVIERADVQVQIRYNWSAAVERALFGGAA